MPKKYLNKIEPTTLLSKQVIMTLISDSSLIEKNYARVTQSLLKLLKEVGGVYEPS